MSVGRKKRRDRRRTTGEERRTSDQRVQLDSREDDVRRPSSPGQAPARLGVEFGSFGVLSKRLPLAAHS